MARILEEGVAGIAGLVTPSALARRSGVVSVDTAYRLLGGPNEVLARVATTAVDPSFSSTALGWHTTDEISATAIGESVAADAPVGTGRGTSSPWALASFGAGTVEADGPS